MSTEQTQLPRLFTPEEAADYLKVSEWFVRQLIREKRIKATVKVGRRNLFTEADLAAFVKAGGGALAPRPTEKAAEA